jgi:hypothetical protein
MDTLTQILSAIYVALGEAAGGTQFLLIANKVIRDAIADGSIDDPMAIAVLDSISHDEDDTDCGRALAGTFTEMIGQLGTTA